MIAGYTYPSAPIEHGVFKCASGAEYADDHDLRQCDLSGCHCDTCEDCALRCDLYQNTFCSLHAVSVPHPGKSYDDIVCDECIARIVEARGNAA